MRNQRESPAVSRRQWLLSAVTLLPALRSAGAQDTTFSTNVNVVNVVATVRNHKGEIIRDLTKGDFKLMEDGQPQEIRYFAQESNLPLTLGLLVDTSMSQRRVLGLERRASARFLEQVLREKTDMAFLIHFDREVELLQDLTASRASLEKALDGLEIPEFGNRGGGSGGGPRNPGGGGGGGGYPGGGGRGRRGAGTQMYDAILLASDELMRRQHGRKALILLTDGVDNGSKVTLFRSIEAAQRADTLGYSILFEDPDAYNRGYGSRRMGRRGGMGGPPQQSDRPDGRKVLKQISRETGGGFFEVTKKQPIEKIYERIQEELRSQYNLGYTSDQKNSSYSYRKITLTTKKKDLVVQTRDGYYPVQPKTGGATGSVSLSVPQ